MSLEKIIQIPQGLTFDFSNIFGENQLDPLKVEALLEERDEALHAAMVKLRTEGIAKAHLSKDGTPEHVFFRLMPYVGEGMPNTPESIQRLKDFGEELRNYDAVLFLGIGGSYLGSKVLMDAIGGISYNGNDQQRAGRPRIYFSGNNLDAEFCCEQIKEIHRHGQKIEVHEKRKKRVMLVPISKSGTTLETMCGFLYFYETLSKDENIDLSCAVVTDLKADPANSPLLQLANENGWWKFDIKEGIGGRFSVMTDVGLLTLAALGADIDAFLQGARDLDQYVRQAGPLENPAMINALVKYLLYLEGRDIEVFMPYSMRLKSLSEWYVQLLAESLGKRYDRNGRLVHYGRTPIVAVGTTDMHAQTQQHQEGRLNKVVQFIEVDKPQQDIRLKNPFPQVPFFNKLQGLKMHQALKIALKANATALAGDNRYNARFVMPTINEYYLGQMMYFLMLTVAYEGELADVDAYDQPGVEVYKRIMKEYL